MMRSLYSGVAGLKTHQTKMDVIGNNIANVNTTAYKAQNITFNELMYQTTKRASGASAETGVGGTNANQIGLGVKVGAINTNIATQGAMQTTNLPFDIAITGDAFFVVNNGLENYFTRAGSFYIDGAGNLAMTSTGYNVMGWQPDTDNPNNIRKDTVTALRLMTEANLTYPPEATTMATVSGIVDQNDNDINARNGKVMNLEFYDNLGYRYTARFAVHLEDADSGRYYTRLVDILDANGVSIGEDRLTGVSFGMQNLEVMSNLTYPLRASGTGDTTDYSISVSTRAVAPATPISISGTVDGAITGTPTQAEIEALYGLDAWAAVNVTPAPNLSINSSGSLVVGTSPNTTTFSHLSNVDANIVDVTVSRSGLPAVTLPVGSAAKPQANVAAVNNFVLVTPATDPVSYTVAGATPPVTLDVNQIRALYGDIPMDDVTEFIIDSRGALVATMRELNDVVRLEYDPSSGSFVRAGDDPDGNVVMSFEGTLNTNFSDISINFTSTLMSNNNGRATIGASAGGTGENRGLGAGRRIGEMIEIIVQDDGRIYANYDNGQSRLLGQIATATFPNPSGLEKKGDNLYSATMNSGEFDGIGEDIKVGGGYMTSGVLEMSNVDLSSEFTEMITTQRGFQANSRIITVSDSLLEELTNLKR